MQEEDKDRYFHSKEIREIYPKIWPLQQATVYAALAIMVLFAALILHTFVGVVLFPEMQSVFDKYVFALLLFSGVWTAAATAVLHVTLFYRMNREERRKNGRYVLPAYAYYEYSDSRRGYITHTVFNIVLVSFALLMAAGLSAALAGDLFFNGNAAVETATGE